MKSQCLSTNIPMMINGMIPLRMDEKSLRLGFAKLYLSEALLEAPYIKPLDQEGRPIYDLHWVISLTNLGSNQITIEAVQITVGKHKFSAEPFKDIPPNRSRRLEIKSMGAKECLEGKIAKIEIRTSLGINSFRMRVPRELKDYSWNELTRLKRESKESRDARLLRCIKESESEGISINDISRKTGIPRSTVSRRIKEFEEKGWVKILERQLGRRGYRITITKEGEKALRNYTHRFSPQSLNARDSLLDIL